MNHRTYTNTGKVKDVLGLIVTTVALVYAAEHSTEIVEGAVSLSKSLAKNGKELINKAVTKEVEVWSTDKNGVAYRTGATMRVSKFQKTDAA